MTQEITDIRKTMGRFIKILFSKIDLPGSTFLAFKIT